MCIRLGTLCTLVAFGFVGFPIHQGAAQSSYPTRQITIIVPFPAGGNIEIVARPLADRLSSSLAQPVIIENRPGGAGGTVGTKAVANAKPDGYTLLLTPFAPLVTAPAIYKNLGYDASKDFAPVATLFSVPHMLAVHPALPVDSMQRLVSYAKGNPGKISYASPGFGTQPHLLAELFRLRTGANIVHVPYKGATPAIADILAGQVQMYFDSVALFLPHIQAGKLRALAVADDSRSDQLPGIPTTAESGFPELQGAFWACVAAPAGTPEDIVNRLNHLINRVLQSPEIGASLAKFGAKQRSGSPQDLAALWSRETEKWAKIISAAGIKAD
jgi:tripartite-type tricarboxylate transporter receptor subunit TctC